MFLTFSGQTREYGNWQQRLYSAEPCMDIFFVVHIYVRPLLWCVRFKFSSLSRFVHVQVHIYCPYPRISWTICPCPCSMHSSIRVFSWSMSSPFCWRTSSPWSRVFELQTSDSNLKTWSGPLMSTLCKIKSTTKVTVSISLCPCKALAKFV